MDNIIKEVDAGSISRERSTSKSALQDLIKKSARLKNSKTPVKDISR